MLSTGGGNDEDDESKPEVSSVRNLHQSSLSLDSILRLLAHHQRRDLVQHLAELPDQTASLDDCVSHLVERHEMRTGERPSHEKIKTALYHIHIPQLLDTGIVEYDPRNQEIRYWGNDSLEVWLDRILADDAEPD